MDAASFEVLSRLSAGALLVAAIASLVLRYVYTRGEVRDRESVWRERLAEIGADRDSWKAIATSSLAKLDRLTDVVEAFSGKKLE